LCFTFVDKIVKELFYILILDFFDFHRSEELLDSFRTMKVTGVKGVVHIVLADRVYIDSSGMANKVKRQLRRMATFSNRQYFQNQAMDLPNYDESRFIYLGSDEGKHIVLPRGLREEILRKFDNAGVSYTIEDKRTEGRKINISFKGESRESQISAVETMLENETGILHAATAFGKTVVCCNMIVRRGFPNSIFILTTCGNAGMIYYTSTREKKTGLTGSLPRWKKSSRRILPAKRMSCIQTAFDH